MESPSQTLLIRHADVLVTLDPRRREIPDGAVLIRDGWIEQVGPTAELPATADKVIDASGQVVLPGLVNTHHHLYQTLTRAVPAAQNANLFGWLVALYPLWARLTPEGIRSSTLVGLAELALSGCTTAFDHHYVFPAGCQLDQQIEAAELIGLRFHASRGSMSLGESEGGLPPDAVVESEEAILADSRRVIEKYHDERPGSMLRIVVAPCSPFSVTAALMRESAALARSYGVRLHTHLAETIDEEKFCLSAFGARPVEYMESLGWLGSDVWFAHAVHVNEGEVGLLARTSSGVAHCATSNMRLASGIAPVAAYLAKGVPVGLGVDGSASNDGSHMLAETRHAFLLARLAASLAPAGEERPLMSARAALEMATLGGAAVLGRDDIGSIEPGKCGDVFGVDLSAVGFAGAGDPVAAVVMCQSAQAAFSVVNGRLVVQDGQIASLDMLPVLETHRRLAAAMVRGEGPA